MSGSVTRGTYFDREVSFPLEVSEFNVATLVFDVPFEAARRLIPGAAFEPVPTGPDSAQFILTAGDYRRTQWSSCHQMTFALVARPVGAAPGAAGMFVHRTPVDDAFTYAIGHGAMDYPISIELIKVRYGPAQVAFTLMVGVQPTLDLRIPRSTARGRGGRLHSIAYTYRNRVPYAMPVETDLSHAHEVDPAAVLLTLGRGPVADELRSLGLPKAPSSCLWGEGLTATFHAGRPLRFPADTPA